MERGWEGDVFFINWTLQSPWVKTDRYFVPFHIKGVFSGAHWQNKHERWAVVEQRSSWLLVIGHCCRPDRLWPRFVPIHAFAFMTVMAKCRWCTKWSTSLKVKETHAANHQWYMFFQREGGQHGHFHYVHTGCVGLETTLHCRNSCSAPATTLCPTRELTVSYSSCEFESSCRRCHLGCARPPRSHSRTQVLDIPCNCPPTVRPCASHLNFPDKKNTPTVVSDTESCSHVLSQRTDSLPDKPLNSPKPLKINELYNCFENIFSTSVAM